MINRILSRVRAIRDQVFFLSDSLDEELDKAVRRVAELHDPHNQLSGARLADFQGRYRSFSEVKERFSGMPEKYMGDMNLARFFMKRSGGYGDRLELDIRLGDGRLMSIACSDVKVGRYDVSIDGESAGFYQNKKDGSDPVQRAYEVCLAGETERLSSRASAPRG